MKIAVLTSSWPRQADDPGGRFVLGSCLALAERGHRVVVMPLEAGHEPAGLEVRPLGARMAGTGGMLSRLRRRPQIAAQIAARLLPLPDLRDADRVVCHWAAPLPILAQAAGVDPRRLRTWCHGSGLRLPGAALLLGRRHQLAVVSPHQRAALPSRFSGKIRCIPVPVTTPIRPRVAPEKRLVFVGRLVPQKGPQLLPKLLDALPGWRAVVVGEGPLGESLGMDPRIELLGPLPPEAWPDRVGSGVGLMPSQGPEGTPLTVDELRRAGLPVVASDLPGLRQRIRHGRDGWLVPPEEVEDWVAAIKRAQSEPVPPAPVRPGGEDWAAFVDWVCSEAV